MVSCPCCSSTALSPEDRPTPLVRVPNAVALILIADWARLPSVVRADVLLGDDVADPESYETAAHAPLDVAQLPAAVQVNPHLFTRLQNDFSDHPLGWAGEFGATKGFRSLSIGDVVRLGHDAWFRCAVTGWVELTSSQTVAFEAAFGNTREPAVRVAAARPAPGRRAVASSESAGSPLYSSHH